MLSGLEWRALAALTQERLTILSANGDAERRWDINDNETAVLLKFLNNRIQELENKKKEP
jgi:hypothetical protein